MAASLRQQVQSLAAAMWKITPRGFTLQEVLIMAAMNVASADNDRQKRANDLAQPRTPRLTRKDHRILPADEEISLAAIYL
jgi:hypothetical protein